MNEFQVLSERLREVMLEEHIAVHPQRNPVLQNLNGFDATQMTSILQQYSILPKAFVVLLEALRDQAAVAGWGIAVQELNDNLAEELGGKTQGIAHADLLAEGLELCLQVPVKMTVPSTATAAFLERLEIIPHLSIAYAFGAAYAIEATAVPELKIIIQLLELLLEGAMPERLQYFFDMHLNAWEPEHEADLRKAIASHLQADQFSTFALGFRTMMTMMDAWWSGLAAEAMTQQAVKSVSRG